ncbi:MAG: MotA/TolQ/ExbB proton channel family protein [Pseudomonadales bacterium]|nr:MotA/TolQ/ExbB proton channel family protein [Pseudomonadales bacterium]
MHDHSLKLRSLIIIGVLAFLFYLAADLGLLQIALESDKSFLSYLIFAVYICMSAHWLFLAFSLSADRQFLHEIEIRIQAGQAVGLALDDGQLVFTGHKISRGVLPDYLRNLLLKFAQDMGEAEQTILLGVLEDEMIRRHAPGHFAADTLLKMGLLGTILGFIFMLSPISEISEFDAAVLQQLLAAMSGGMALALITTLLGLIGSTLLNFQYQILESSAVDFLNRVTIITNVHRARLHHIGE